MLSFDIKGQNSLFVAPSGRAVLYDLDRQSDRWMFSPAALLGDGSVNPDAVWHNTEEASDAHRDMESAWPTQAWRRYACLVHVEVVDITAALAYTSEDDVVTFDGEIYKRHADAPAKVTPTLPVYPRQLLAVVYSTQLKQYVVIVRNDSPCGKYTQETLYCVDQRTHVGEVREAFVIYVREHDQISSYSFDGHDLIQMADGRWMLDGETTMVELVADFRFEENPRRTAISLQQR